MADIRKITFEKLPENSEELRGMPQFDQHDQFSMAALLPAVLCRYDDSPQDTIDMLNVLRGSRNMSPYDLQFLRDRMTGKAYIARSYFEGAVPENNYKPSVPYTVTVSDNLYSYTDSLEGYVKLDIRSSGADSPRQVQLRQKGGLWFLWENFLMADIKAPEGTGEWQ
ncbi:MAG: hypothetical protein K5876_05965 [Ruminiclostridium sp.]|nr:hypothetical protein [Ruminiclostridium sp.]